MAKINVLSKHIAELIAAGEVVERPASVVKELMENSIDAGATSITLEIRNGGVTYIRITDNGCGIEHDDVPKAFISHATSKIADENDLNSIFTLGFRGEALASIAAVSRTEILTKAENEQTGTSYAVGGPTAVIFSHRNAVLLLPFPGTSSRTVVSSQWMISHPSMITPIRSYSGVRNSAVFVNRCCKVERLIIKPSRFMISA